MPSGGCNVTLCLSRSGLPLSSKCAGKILVMWKIQKYKTDLVSELIPVNAKMRSCALSTVSLQVGEKKDKSSFFSIINGFLPSSVNVSFHFCVVRS